MSTDEMAGVPVLQSPHQIDFLNKVDNLSKSHEWTFFLVIHFFTNDVLDL